MSADNNRSYDANTIRVLKGLDAVRTRPGMYIGNTDDGTGLHHMVFEVVDNSIDEALAGYCSNIKVVIHEDNSVSVTDDGRGIPTAIHPEEGVSSAEVVMTVLHAGGKFDAKTIAGGLHGVGVSVVNALSSKLFLRIRRDGKVHEQTYHNGVPQAPLTVTGTTDKTGTMVRFWPSHETFKNVTEFSYDILCNRLRELSFLNSNVRIELKDERDGRHDEFHYAGGLQEFVKFLNTNKTVINEEPFYFQSVNEELGITVEVAMQWNDTYKESVHCFTNNIPQRDGGTHLIGFKAALTRSLNGYIEREVIANAKSKALKDLKIDGDDSREGLVAIISVKVPNPKFSSQTKDKLVSSEVRGVVESTINDKFQTILEENPKIARTIVDKVISAARTREAARRARELARTNKKHTFTTNKLVHCNSRNPEECEVYLVEGDSAGGSAVKARDVQTQAILPLRGKILNVEKARFDKIIESQEIANIIAVLKCGINDEFNLDNLRYHKIVIMTDADVDGSHIRTLLLTFFFRQMPQLIEAGKIYIAQPPLYKLMLDRKAVYLKNNDEYNRFLIDYALEGADLEVKGQVYSSSQLKDLCDRYLKLSAKISAHNKKYSPEVMETLISYLPLNESMFTNAQDFTAWMNGLLDLLKSTQDQSIRYEAHLAEDEETKELYYRLSEIKHGMEATYTLNRDFLMSKDYQEVASLAHDLKDILPVSQDTSERYMVRGEVRKPIKYFNDFVSTLLTLATSKLKPSRYKGLGEMNWEELEETTMKVENRTLLKVEVKDAILADQLFTTLMGDEVTPRRDFIEENALYANIDL
ncbi:DNA gyrase subunit B [Psittacicella hinzii]|uniref:DNA gyrase subunit B n=1 Tax=Psittacicella hinzii TaxID=2028575 RepID=A0A3A1YGA6_9GAMM|nr:DNA gyrase subunit B [Psittacicella hinzii]RIY35244.1 DNA gyrase subunit B [Psittacicella hinzii]